MVTPSLFPRWRLALFLSCAILTGCGDDLEPTDAAVDVDSAEDVGSDAMGDAADASDDSATDASDDSATDARLDTAEDVASDVGEDASSPSGSRPNILLLIADDLGVDEFGPFAEDGADRVVAPMPNVAGLCERGARFRRAWAYPTCSPTRASLLTGRFGFRTGIGAPVGTLGLDPEEPTIPRLLDSAGTGYAHANIGKWHVGTTAALGGDDAPNNMGWSHFEGTMTGGLRDYFSYQEVVNGATQRVTQYATSEQVDDAIRWVDAQQAETPVFLWVAFNAPHTPFHLPPAELHSADDLADSEAAIAADPRAYFQAALEALDTEIGRLIETFDGRPQETVIVFLGDNGSPRRVITAPYERTHSKDTLYEGGVHVPLCVAGAGVTEGDRQQLVHTVDLHATLVELAGGSADDGELAVDGQSFAAALADAEAPGRAHVYTESFNGMNPAGRVVRGERYKLIRYTEDGSEELYDLDEDPFEATNLIGMRDGALADAYAELSAALATYAE